MTAWILRLLGIAPKVKSRGGVFARPNDPYRAGLAKAIRNLKQQEKWS